MGKVKFKIIYLSIYHGNNKPKIYGRYRGKSKESKHN